MPHGQTLGTTEPTPKWPREALLVFLLVAAVGITLGWASRGAALTVYGDESIALTLSRSLAAGHYRDEFLVGAPPHAQYPPGMPIWLLLLRLTTGGSLDAALAANLLLIALTAFLLADSVRRLSTPWLGVTAAMMVMYNPPLFVLAAELRSEIPFLALCALALWLSLVDAQRASRWYPALAIAVAIAAFLTRSAGIAMLPAIGWALFLQRKWRPLLIGGIVAVATTLSWFAYTRWAGQHTIGHTYATDLAVVVPASEPVRFLGHLINNAKTYFARLAERQFGITDLPDQPLDNLILGFALTLPAAAGAWMLARRWPAMVMYLFLSVGILLIFPWPISRLFVPLTPWLAVMILIGCAGIATTAGSRHGNTIAIGVGVVLAGFGLVGRVEAARRAQECRASAPFVDPRCYPEQYRSYVAAVDFIRDSLPTNAVVAAAKASFVFERTGRLTVPLELFAQTKAARLLAPAGPATHILLSRLIPFEADLVGPRLRAQCTLLALLARYPSGTLLLGRHTASAGDSTDACIALTEYLRETPADPDDAHR